MLVSDSNGPENIFYHPLETSSYTTDRCEMSNSYTTADMSNQASEVEKDRGTT